MAWRQSFEHFEDSVIRHENTYIMVRNLNLRVNIGDLVFSADSKYECKSLETFFFNFARYLHGHF
jgi:hypothetical protein